MFPPEQDTAYHGRELPGSVHVPGENPVSGLAHKDSNMSVKSARWIPQRHIFRVQIDGLGPAAYSPNCFLISRIFAILSRKASSTAGSKWVPRPCSIISRDLSTEKAFL